MQFQSFLSTLNARMYLYNTPRDTIAKDPMLQSLCSTSTWKDLGIMCNMSNYLLMCYNASRSTLFINQSRVLELLTQHKTSCQSCTSRSTPITNKHIHISSIIGLCPINKKNHHVHMQWGPCPNIK